MTPAELNHWAATDVMGWTKLEQGDGWPDVWVHSEDYKALVMNCSEWNSHLSHDDCQQVIEKAIERGACYESIEDYLDRAYYVSPLLATAEQKLRAVWQACKEMEKK